VFFRGCIETKEHLFFECGYGCRLWRELFKKSPCSNPPIHWPDIMSLGGKEWKNKSFKSVICKLSLNSAVYYLWRKTNDISHGSPPKSKEKMVHEIIWIVKNRVKGERQV
jgi:hypothetical protein